MGHAGEEMILDLNCVGSCGLDLAGESHIGHGNIYKLQIRWNLWEIYGKGKIGYREVGNYETMGYEI